MQMLYGRVTSSPLCPVPTQNCMHALEKLDILSSETLHCVYTAVAPKMCRIVPGTAEGIVLLSIFFLHRKELDVHLLFSFFPTCIDEFPPISLSVELANLTPII